MNKIEMESIFKTRIHGDEIRLEFWNMFENRWELWKCPICGFQMMTEGTKHDINCKFSK